MNTNDLEIKQGELSQESLEAEMFDNYTPSVDLSDEDYHPELDYDLIKEQSLAFKKNRAKKSAA